MILIPYSYNGTLLNSTDYVTNFPRAQAQLQLEANPSYIKRAGAVPVFSGKDFQPVSLILEIDCGTNFMEKFEALNTLFDTKDETPRQFVCSDNSTTDLWYVYATPKKVLGGHDGPMATVTLALDDPIWQSYVQSSLTFSTTDSTDSTTITVTGNDYSYPIFEITPVSQPTVDYLYNMYVQVLPTSVYPWNNRFLDVTGSTGTWDTAALVSGGKMTTDGDDLRVFRDGVEIDRWLSGFNTTDTHVIVACDMPRAYNMTLRTALDSTSPTPAIVLNYTSANITLINALPKTGRLIIDSALGSTDTEEFTYTAKYVTRTAIYFTTGARAVRGTTAVAHAINANVRYLPYDFNIIYGNSAAATPVTDDTRKPLQDLTSRNNSFVYTNFYDAAGTRPGQWTQAYRTVASPIYSRSEFYTSTNDVGDTDPASAMGLATYTYQYLGAWKADTVTMLWLGYFPDGIASVSASGAQKQTSSNRPSFYFQRAPSFVTGIVNLWTLAAQSATDYNTWTTFNKPSSDYTIPAGQYVLRWVAYGTQAGSTDASVKAEISSLTVGLTNVPHVMLRTEQNNYKLDCTLTNTTTGDSMRVVYPMLINETLIIDTDPDFPTAKHKGVIVNGAISLSSVRAAWLKLQPGANVITYVTNMGAASGITIVNKWRNRMNFF